jgi:hypothetical protein
MMYDHEKSDPGIVAVMPTNKAGQPAAELAEPRAGARGMCVSKARAGHGPGNRVTGAGAHTASRKAKLYRCWPAPWRATSMQLR